MVYTSLYYSLPANLISASRRCEAYFFDCYLSRSSKCSNRQYRSHRATPKHHINMRCIIPAIQTLHFTPRVIPRSDSLAGGVSATSILHLITGPPGTFLCALDSFLVMDMERSAYIKGFVLLLSKCRLPLIVCDVVLDQVKKKVTD